MSSQWFMLIHVLVLQCGVTKVSRFIWRKLWDQYRGAGPSQTEVDQTKKTKKLLPYRGSENFYFIEDLKNFYLIEDLKARIIQLEVEVAICIFWQKKTTYARHITVFCTIWPDLLLRVFPGIPPPGIDETLSSLFTKICQNWASCWAGGCNCCIALLCSLRVVFYDYFTQSLGQKKICQNWVSCSAGGRYSCIAL